MKAVEATLGTLLRQSRRERSLTQRDLAETSGVSARTIGDIETGVAVAPRRSTLAALADALELAGVARARLMRHAADGNTLPNRPFPSNPFAPIGRDREIARIADAVRTRASRVSTIFGAGGVGKTTVAIEVARAAAADFDGGLVFVRLEDLSSADGVAGAILEALALPTIAPIVDAAHASPRLVVLDNFEHLVEAASTLASLLEAVPSATFLVTSRCVLGIRSEVVFELKPLAAADAVRLFCASAERAGLADALASSGADRDLRGICASLDCIPLAIELMVPLLRSSSLRDLEARLRAQLPLHAQGHRDSARRHRSIATSLEWSFERIGDTARDVAYALAFFAGPARVEWIAACSGISLTTAMDAVAELWSAGLAQRFDWTDGEPRVGFFKMVRDHLLERARAEARYETLCEAHARWLVSYGESVRRNASESTIAALVERGPEIQDAVAWAYSRRRGSDGIAIASSLLWPKRIHEGLDPETMRLCAHRVGRFLDWGVVLSESELAARSRARNVLCGMLMSLGKYRVAEEMLRSGLSDQEREGDLRRQADSVVLLAFNALNDGRFGDVRGYLDRLAALAASQPADDIALHLTARASSAFARFLLDDLEEAERSWRSAEEASREPYPAFAAGVRAHLSYLGALRGVSSDDDSERWIAEAEATADDEIAFRLLAADGIVASRHGNGHRALARFGAAFERSIGSTDTNARESAAVGALHAASVFADLDRQDDRDVALRVSSALLRRYRKPLYPVYARYFARLSLAAIEDGDAVDADVRALREILTLPIIRFRRGSYS